MSKPEKDELVGYSFVGDGAEVYDDPGLPDRIRMDPTPVALSGIEKIITLVKRIPASSRVVELFRSHEPEFVLGTTAVLGAGVGIAVQGVRAARN